ncbi:MAG: leucine-rich repeat domain-containing protein, partial [Acutalibacteraceae bacterium]|nr:leucine-rich repeat domain-containing protein [Acutalibacteraceae bacterium]
MRRNDRDFVIENGVLVKYSGTEGDVIIPDGITEIGTAAFEDCATLESITIPEGVTKIGTAAFEYCAALGRIVIPDSVTEIGVFA